MSVQIAIGIAIGIGIAIDLFGPRPLRFPMPAATKTAQLDCPASPVSAALHVPGNDVLSEVWVSFVFFLRTVAAVQVVRGGGHSCLLPLKDWQRAVQGHAVPA